MAITIEEERKPVNWLAIIGVIIAVVVVFVGSYFLFFKRPELIDVVTPSPVQKLNDLSRLTFDPKAFLDPSSQEKAVKVFRTLRQYGTDLVLPTPGRTNPFKPF